MKKRTLSILVVIFILLALGASYSWWSQYFNINSISRSYVQEELNFSDFTPESTSKIVIAVFKDGKEEDKKELAKQDGGWTVNGFEASAAEIDDFFKTLAVLDVRSLVSKNPQNHSNFEVTQDDGIALSLVKNDAETVFIIGKRGVGADSFYAKKKDSKNVYLVSGLLRGKLLQEISLWRDRTVVNVAQEDIQKIKITPGAKELIITREEGRWRADGFGKTALLDEPRATRLLAALAPLEAEGFLDNKEQKEFDEAKGKTTLLILGSGEKELARLELLKKDNEWWAVLTGREVYYRIPDYRVDAIFLSESDIFDKTEETN